MQDRRAGESAVRETMLKENNVNREELRALVLDGLQEQGFREVDGILHPPGNDSKEDIRTRHRQAVRHNIERAEKYLSAKESVLLKHIADGAEIKPEQLDPELVEVHPKSENELLFRYAALHWSIPVSSGYGRRLRFLILDRSNGKLIGILGLGDPVFSIRARDRWVGWDRETRKTKLRHVMEAFVLGAVPPYSFLLCGKLVALLATSDEVREAFQKKYNAERAALISGVPNDSRLALITTISALGRSSVYNRLNFRGNRAFCSVGHTKGWGEIYFSNGLYAPLHAYAKANLDPTSRNKAWGQGFRNRQEVVRKCLADLGFSQRIRRHQICREAFVAPLAENTQEFLSGKDMELRSFRRPTEEISEWFRKRWLQRRAQNDPRYAEWDKSKWRLWGG